MTRLNGPLAIFLFAVAVIYIFQHHAPLSVKVGIVVVAYVLAIHWLKDYAPRTARWIASTTLLMILAMIKGVLSVGSGRRRR